LQPLIDKVWRHCEDKGMRGRTVTLKVKFADFELISRSRTVAGVVGSRSEFENVSAVEGALPHAKGRQAARRFDIRIQTRRNSGRWADSPRALVKRPLCTVNGPRRDPN
jgi:nucleotidyltransferase/DNA polymerase involved in DNA repair